jgi:hypothetical protein
MARKSSKSYSPASELRVSSAALDRRWPSVSEELRAELGFGRGDLSVHPEYAEDIVAAGFVGRACEVVERHRGRNSRVAPLSAIGNGSLMAWLGFHEAWESKPGKMYAFHHVSLTVHVGYTGDPIKPQIFRSEWPGFRAWSASGVGFQSPGVGHPHWQFDAMKTLYDSDISLRDKILARLREEAVTVEFVPPIEARDAVTALQELALDRIHFASAAPWWLSQMESPYGVHMNAPPNADALLRWIVGCVSYIRQELKRC